MRTWPVWPVSVTSGARKVIGRVLENRRGEGVGVGPGFLAFGVILLVTGAVLMRTGDALTVAGYVDPLTVGDVRPLRGSVDAGVRTGCRRLLRSASAGHSAEARRTPAGRSVRRERCRTGGPSG
jgi:hypothetical protein